MDLKFSFDKLKDVVGNNKESFDKMIEVIIKQLSENIKKIKTSFENKDLEAIRFNFHSIRSTMLYLGAEDLSKLAKDIEERAENKIMDNNMDEKINSFLKYINQAYSELKSRFK